MKRSELEHVVRAASSITNRDKFVIVGSQAILGSFPDAPQELTASNEADIYPLDAPAEADLIDGSIGERSPFHETFGYYAHGVSPETAVLPKNWQHRVISVQNENTRGAIALCVSAIDLAVSKLAAGREKDLEFVRGMLRYRIVEPDAVRALLPELDEERAALVGQRLERCARYAAI